MEDTLQIAILRSIEKRVNFISHLVIQGVFGALGWVIYHDNMNNPAGTFYHDYAFWVSFIIYFVGTIYCQRQYDKIP